MKKLDKMLYSVNGNIAILTINRPERRNALDADTLGQINVLMDRAENDEKVRVILINGNGDTFSSGFDLKDQMEKAPQGEQWKPILELDHKTIMRFWNSPKPTIAAVKGACLAGAFELSLACDLTICSKDSFFGEPELKFGAGIVTMLLPWVIGMKAAKTIILLGKDNISSSRALELGIVSEVTEDNKLLQKSLQVAKHISAVDPNLVKKTKKAINQSFETAGLHESLKKSLEIDYQIESRGSPDKKKFMEVARKEGMRAAIKFRDTRFSIDE
jgi:enoyl-CoA hydratase/carnithine racemase